MQVTKYIHHQNDRYHADAVEPKNNLTKKKDYRKATKVKVWLIREENYKPL